MQLFERSGYAATTIADIALACGMGRSSFFRYFPSKSDIVWRPFDEHVEGLRRRLGPEVAPADVMEHVVREVTLALGDSIDDDGVWMSRFRVLDGTPELAADEAARWRDWSETVVDFVERSCPGLDPVTPQAVAGAVQATFLAVLRSWVDHQRPGPDLLPRLRDHLEVICGTLEPLLHRR